MKRILLASLCGAGCLLVLAAAQILLKMAIGQINNWENQPPTLGQDAGIFKKYNIVMENFRHSAVPAKPCKQ